MYTRVYISEVCATHISRYLSSDEPQVRAYETLRSYYSSSNVCILPEKNIPLGEKRFLIILAVKKIFHPFPSLSSLSEKLFFRNIHTLHTLYIFYLFSYILTCGGASRDMCVIYGYTHNTHTPHIISMLSGYRFM